MGRRVSDISGERFGRLVVTSRSDRVSKSGNVIWNCICDCGRSVQAAASALRSASTISCGCYRKSRMERHGKSGTSLYQVWCSMRQRCNNPDNKDFLWYGGNGVAVCPEWDDFKAFEDWAHKNGYAQGLTIDREDTGGDYDPKNCRFITIQRQQRNKRSNRPVIIDGHEVCLADAIESSKDKFAIGVTSSTVRSRVSGYGWSFEKAISTPLNSTKGRTSKKAEALAAEE